MASLTPSIEPKAMGDSQKTVLNFPVNSNINGLKGLLQSKIY